MNIYSFPATANSLYSYGDNSNEVIPNVYLWNGVHNGTDTGGNRWIYGNVVFGLSATQWHDSTVSQIDCNHGRLYATFSTPNINPIYISSARIRLTASSSASTFGAYIKHLPVVPTTSYTSWQNDWSSSAIGSGTASISSGDYFYINFNQVGISLLKQHLNSSITIGMLSNADYNNDYNNFDGVGFTRNAVLEIFWIERPPPVPSGNEVGAFKCFPYLGRIKCTWTRPNYDNIECYNLYRYDSLLNTYYLIQMISPNATETEDYTPNEDKRYYYAITVYDGSFTYDRRESLPALADTFFYHPEPSLEFAAHGGWNALRHYIMTIHNGTESYRNRMSFHIWNPSINANELIQDSNMIIEGDGKIESRNIEPLTNGLYNLGTETKKWNELFSKESNSDDVKTNILKLWNGR